MRALPAEEMEEGYSHSRAEGRMRRLVRDAELPTPIFAAAGRVAIRVTWRPLRNEPMAVAVRLAQALALRAAERAPAAA
jgi:hypothetical protein